MSWIREVPEHLADGVLADAYARIAASRGKVANILRVHSLRPEAMLRHVDLYMDLLFAPGGLTRAQREVIAVVVSRENRCAYCVAHHREALQRYIKDTGLLDALCDGSGEPQLDPPTRALVVFAASLTRSPEEGGEARVAALRDAGFDDEAILLATLVAAYFNFVNRIALGLGVESGADEIAGYGR
jgi:uncharacterized peroxidase-related enzyme